MLQLRYEIHLVHDELSTSTSAKTDSLDQAYLYQ
jgi:hypothetical protein